MIELPAAAPISGVAGSISPASTANVLRGNGWMAMISFDDAWSRMTAAPGLRKIFPANQVHLHHRRTVDSLLVYKIQNEYRWSTISNCKYISFGGQYS